jgi:hypothetical protein
LKLHQFNAKTKLSNEKISLIREKGLLMEAAKNDAIVGIKMAQVIEDAKTTAEPSFELPPVVVTEITNVEEEQHSSTSINLELNPS